MKPRLGRVATAILLLAVGVASAPEAMAQGPERATLRGKVVSGAVPLVRTPVSVQVSGIAKGRSQRLARTVTDGRGRFELAFRKPGRRGAVLYVVAGRGAAVRLAATLGSGRLPGRIVVNELTTAATGYALAQFVSPRGRIGGPYPGPRNAAMMAANLADPRSGRVAGVLRTAPNGSQTRTLATFRSVANMLAACARSERRCGPLLRLAGTKAAIVVRP